ncbi:DoxX family membrane protein [Streptomyces neyagawaensis]|uniref:DoxX family membrane protein n=1 Tax=Streptomyces neyagawaensis TaxID=42238 RepID=UPI0006E16ED4|nr:DoxX family membrane protein [Streptomyces neyagawaensis]MCL6731199.1 DoxX family membrane protein [Streptomyces neyagawaensis]MDE1683678.1 DoxX family membrane protein [Streptomyces neyagawaensis]
MDTGLLLLRLVAGLLIAGHGVQKVSFLLGGNGLAGGTEEFRRDGFRGGRLTALAAGGGQLGAGLFLAAGLLTPLAATTAMGVMTVASTVKWRNGLWVQNDGYEYPLVLVLVAAVLALTGPGRWAGDALLGFAPWPLWVSVTAVVLGPAAGFATRAVLHRPAPTAGPEGVTRRA